MALDSLRDHLERKTTWKLLSLHRSYNNVLVIDQKSDWCLHFCNYFIVGNQRHPLRSPSESRRFKMTDLYKALTLLTLLITVPLGQTTVPESR